MTPKISIIIPVYNGRGHIEETIRCIQKQTFEDYEIILVDDQSADGTYECLQRLMAEDSRIRVLRQEHAGAGAARNRGFSEARGEYVIFSDSDDLYTSEMLEKLWKTASDNQADVAACNYIGLDSRGKENRQVGVHKEWLPAGAAVFSHLDCPINILRAAGSVVWNKLYRSDFIRRNGLKFDELQTCNDLSFVAVSMAAAERIAYTSEHLVRYYFPRLNNPKNPEDVYAAVESTIRQVRRLPHEEKLRNAVAKFVLENLISALKRFVKDFSDPVSAAFYQRVHETFNSGDFRDLKPEQINNSEMFREFSTVKKHDYEAMKKLRSRRIIVSLTSFPKRIGTLIHTLETIYAQTRKADEIVLWLAEEQFPGKEQDLPEDLRQLAAENRLTIRWCEDLKGHKKFFYALQEYTEDVVVTIDDDLLYPKDMLEILHKSYLLHPNAVSTMRAHLIMVSEDGRVMPYKKWIHEVDGCIHKPSMQVMTSGGAGDLYPPNLYRKEFFDRDVILDICLWADNLWCKAMELASDVPVVLVQRFAPLRCVDGSQEETLYQVNGDQNQYDIQMEKISQWMDETFEPGIMVKKLTSNDVGEKLWGVEAVAALLDEERRSNRWKNLRSEDRIRILEAEKKQREARCRELESGLAQREKELLKTADQLHRTENSLKETSRKLQLAENRAAKLEPLASFGGQYKELGRILREMKAQKGVSASWCLKFALYVLGWIPAKLLMATDVYIKNGLKHTIKRVSNKIQDR